MTPQSWSPSATRIISKLLLLAAVSCGSQIPGEPDAYAITSRACISDRGFEEPALAAGYRAYDYNPAGTAWTFTGSAGVSRSPNWFTPNRAPEGNQVAFLENGFGATSICRNLSGLTAANVYHLTFLYGGRAGQPNQDCNYCLGANPFAVHINGTTLATFTDIPIETYTSATLAFTASDGPTRLCFAGLSTGGNRTTFFDDVKIDECSNTKLFIVSSQGRESDDTSNQIYRYAIGGPDDEPVAETAIHHPNLSNPCGLALGFADEMFVLNRRQGLAGQGTISRFVDPAGLHSFNDSIQSPFFSGPVRATFRNRELFIAQRFADNVVRVAIAANGAASFNGFITEGLSSGGVRGVAFAPSGSELFVSQCCGVNQINRYLIDDDGNAIANGTIQGGGLNSPFGLAFSPWGELFAGNNRNHTISRFVFDQSGNAVGNGVISGNGANQPLTLAFSPWGELFAANAGAATVSRWRFDNQRDPVENGTFATRTLNCDLAFLAAASDPGPTRTPTPTRQVTPTATPTGPRMCIGDCDASGSVAVNELVLGVNIALERAELSSCPVAACDGAVNVACLVTAVNNLLRGCP